MSLWSARRGLVEPLPALVAAVAVCLGVTLYAGVLAGALPAEGDRHLARPALDGVVGEVTETGVVDPGRLRSGLAAAPDGYRLRITLESDGRDWTVGPAAPPSADAARARVSVRHSPRRVRPGTLVVEVWS